MIKKSNKKFSTTRNFVASKQYREIDGENRPLQIAFSIIPVTRLLSALIEAQLK